LAEGNEVQVALLSQALLEVRKARGHREEMREAVIRYFKNGMAQGFKVKQLLEWLFFWPSDRWSVFVQADFPGTAGHEFVEMVKGLTLLDLGVEDGSAVA
jgi:hypothetical protein